MSFDKARGGLSEKRERSIKTLTGIINFQLSVSLGQLFFQITLHHFFLRPRTSLADKEIENTVTAHHRREEKKNLILIPVML